MKRFIISIAFATLLFSPTFLFADSSYKVQKGDTLFSISRKFQITINELRAANNMGNGSFIKIGQVITIPTADITTAAALTQNSSSKSTPQTSSRVATQTKQYTIQKGDTLYGIAKKYGIKVNVLLSLNSLDMTGTIKAGQKIKIPADAELAAKRAQIAAAQRSKEAAEKEAKTRLLTAKGVEWPLENPKVKAITGKVSGVELIGREGESVKSVREGTVMYTGVYRGFGEVVFVQSKTGLIYSYTGLKTVNAKKGDYVSKGTEIGALGAGQDASIKFMVFQNGVPLDPVTAPRG